MRKKGKSYMVNYPLDKYHYYFYTSRAADGTERKVVKAVSSYGGHTVMGVAKCSPNDTYNEEVGMHLAALRCAQKIAVAKTKRASVKMNNAVDNYNKAVALLKQAGEYFNDAQSDLVNCNKTLEELISQS